MVTAGSILTDWVKIRKGIMFIEDSLMPVFSTSELGDPFHYSLFYLCSLLLVYNRINNPIILNLNQEPKPLYHPVR